MGLGHARTLPVTFGSQAEVVTPSGDELVTREYLDLRLDALSASIEAKLFGLRGDLSSRVTSLFVGFTRIILGAMAVATTIILAAN
jgi:hypothetical protein